MSSIDQRPVPLPGLLVDLFTSAKPPVGGPPVDTFVADAPVGAAPVPSSPEPLVDLDKPSFNDLVQRLGFDQKAIGVASAEGWHETYGWNDRRQARVLEMLGQVPAPKRNPTRCACRHVVKH